MAKSEQAEAASAEALIVTMKQVREGYPALMQLSSFQENGDGGSVRNFLRGEPKAKRAVVKLLAELRPLHEASEEKVADLREQYTEPKGDARRVLDPSAYRDAIDKHLKETVDIDAAPLRASLLAEQAYADLPAHMEHVLGVFYVDDRELSD